MRRRHFHGELECETQLGGNVAVTTSNTPNRQMRGWGIFVCRRVLW